MRKQLIWVLILFLIPISTALDECKAVTTTDLIPCDVRTTWSPSLDCTSYEAIVFNITGGNQYSINLTDYGTTGLCQFTFNISNTGTYAYNITVGDYGSILVEKEDNMLSIILLQIFLMTFFILAGLPHKVGVLKFFSWGMGLIQLLITVWMVYINEIGGSIDQLLYINSMTVLILGSFIGTLTMFVVMSKILNLNKKSAFNEDGYTKWVFNNK